MTIKYYNDNSNFPPVMQAIANSALYYMAQKLYPDENPDDIINPEFENKKFILADFVNTSEETAIYRSIEELQKISSGTFPFTAYSFSEEEMKLDTKSHYQVSGKVFESNIQGYVQAIPSTWIVPMISFFTNVYDYFRARQYLVTDASKLTRITVPITINEILTSFTIDIEFEIAKGQFAYAYEQYLSTGKIFDLSHQLTIKFIYFILNSANTIYPVTSITSALETLGTLQIESQLIDSYINPITPEILSTIPIDEAIDVDKNNDIVITFNTSMKESSVNSYIDITPMFPCNLIWNDTSTQLTLSPSSGMLSSSTEYTLIIEKESTSINDVPMEDDYTFSFTTGI